MWICFSNIKTLSDINNICTCLFVSSGLVGIYTLLAGLANISNGITYYTFEPNIYIVICVILYLSAPKEWVWIDKHRALSSLFMITCCSTIFLTLSRTILLCLSVFLIVYAIKNIGNFIKITKYLILLCIIMIIISTLILSESTVSAFVDKILNSINEISFDNNIWTQEDIVTNWRGYERYRAIDTFTNTNTLDALFGNGFGYKLDVGQYASLVTDESGLFYLHDGYMNTMLKCGLLGLFSYVLFYALNIKNVFSKYINSKQYSKYFILCCFVLLAITTLFIQGLFVYSASFTFWIPIILFSSIKEEK
ncbi:oligosaccharide repeat unit polymerase Wzy [Bifidobacterium pullorum subsp. saeculare DSM 6531 = LMG 14934]|uniref:Oligosaccharide repeat unit polymerase Wzy n=1 Tax=Bifidobacterium pullorum subsp. saeculare DSM 6531 = LMG 14934 TaxID=1437611 RepID=A0A087CPG1_9BIFI|nr:oligosaccharide repeat unit polymerase Wzy [Bifidobacterium pullorum subsp. saeculare DSM 6531 = LMG 14934]